MDIITLSHGSGGQATNKLINNIFYKHFNNEFLLQQNDSSVLPKINGRISITTDSFVINPIFFPGGDIGKLSICGTVNDLAMSGAKPLYITCAFIIEEGLKIDELEKIVESMAKTAKDAGVIIVTGDTKVVERGSGDKIYINTTGVGVIEDEEIYLSGNLIEHGDKIIVSGTLGDHGICILNKRKNLEFDVDIKSDCGLLHTLISDVLSVSKNVRVLRDPTRGGLATTLNEFAVNSSISIEIEEDQIPIRNEIRSMCDILGMDSLFIANEGKVVVVVSEEDAAKVLSVMKKNPMGIDARIIGTAIKDEKNKVYLKTEIGGKRVVSMPEGELLVRIC